MIRVYLRDNEAFLTCPHTRGDDPNLAVTVVKL